MSNFHDIEAELAKWTKAVWGIDSGTRTPDAITRFVRWTVVGGGDDDITDFPTVDCDVFSATRNDAYGISENIRSTLRPRTRLSIAIIDSVSTVTRPRGLPWDNESIKRIGATYALGLRR